MSRGPGKIERAVSELFEAEPDDAFTTEEICERVFPGVNRVEKKHRVSAMRAAKNACGKIDGWSWSPSEGYGGTLIFWNRYSVGSYARLHLKGDFLNKYRSNDPRAVPHWIYDKDRVEAELAPGGRQHHRVVEGGAWWRHVQLWIAERNGDTSQATQELLKEEERVRRSLGIRPVQ